MKKRTLTAAAVKRLPIGTIVQRVRDMDGAHAAFVVALSYKKKILTLIGCHEVTSTIEDKNGWHYEVEVKDGTD